MLQSLKNHSRISIKIEFIDHDATVHNFNNSRGKLQSFLKQKK